MSISGHKREKVFVFFSNFVYLRFRIAIFPAPKCAKTYSKNVFRNVPQVVYFKGTVAGGGGHGWAHLTRWPGAAPKAGRGGHRLALVRLAPNTNKREKGNELRGPRRPSKTSQHQHNPFTTKQSNKTTDKRSWYSLQFGIHGSVIWAMDRTNPEDCRYQMLLKNHPKLPKSTINADKALSASGTNCAELQ